MKCPFCNYNDTKVIDSRGQEDNSVIRRRRLCESCGKRFTTYERIDMIPITVIKNDGTREIFDKTKIINGVMKSCNKRPVTAQQIQELADDIENTLMGLGERGRKQADWQYGDGSSERGGRGGVCALCIGLSAV